MAGQWSHKVGLGGQGRPYHTGAHTGCGMRGLPCRLTPGLSLLCSLAAWGWEAWRAWGSGLEESKTFPVPQFKNVKLSVKVRKILRQNF